MSEQANRLLKAILDSQLTYVELEKKTGIAKSSIQRYASGTTTKIPIDAVKLIADATNSSAAWIMGWDEAPTPNCIQFSERLKELRLSHNYSMDKLIELYNAKFNGKMNKSTLSRYENGLQEPMYTVVVNLAKLFNVTVDYISGTKASTTDYEKYGLKPIRTKKFPMLGSIACGEPIYADREYETFIEASEDINADFCLTAKGDSMINARIFDGDVVFIREQPDVENGEIAAVQIEDEVTLKRVYKYENRLELRPENPTHKVQNYEGETLNHIRILGKAVVFQSIVR